MSPHSTTLEERFWAKVHKTPTCWNWTGASNRGYGYIGLGPGKGQDVAHRVAYRLLVGPIPDGLTIDHLCRNRGCVNPDHMEPVTTKVNVLRGVGRTARQARQTHCKRGHPFDLFNTYYNNRGNRSCKACGKLWDQAHPHKARAYYIRNRQKK